MTTTPSASSYVLGHADVEVQRLLLQGRLYDDYTEHALRLAGLRPGMRVLDIGSGPGNVSFVAARLVGPTGSVLGVDAAPEMVELARARAAEQGFSAVHFIQSAIDAIELDQPVDAVIGRLILLHLPDPAAALRRLSSFLRPGGVIAFSENDIAGARSVPDMPLFGQVIPGIVRAFEAMGLSARFGTTLHTIFADAGLGAPQLTLGAPDRHRRRHRHPGLRRGGLAAGLPDRTTGRLRHRRGRRHGQLRAALPRRGARDQRPHHDAAHHHGVGAEMSNMIQDQYSTGLSRNNIERALRAAGMDLDGLAPADLGLLEDFHNMGRIATAQLVDLAQITGESRVLDAGSGVGGTARYVADRYGCAVTAVDLTDEYCQTNRWLNGLVGLDDLISVRHADVTELPFAGGDFDVAISQHAQMNVADKARLYSEAHRVLMDGGRLALWDITIGDGGELDYPLPWADTPAHSHLVSPDELHAAVESAGFTVKTWNDLTDQSAALMQAMLAQPPNPLGLHAFVTDFRRKAENLTRALVDGRLRAIQAICERRTP